MSRNFHEKKNSNEKKLRINKHIVFRILLYENNMNIKKC
jgi:hypothetical protein